MPDQLSSYDIADITGIPRDLIVKARYMAIQDSIPRVIIKHVDGVFGIHTHRFLDERDLDESCILYTTDAGF